MKDFSLLTFWNYVIVSIVCVVAANYVAPKVVQYFFMNEEMDIFLTKMTVLIVFLVLSIYGSMFLIRKTTQVREGFAESIESQWKTLTQNEDLDNVCTIYSGIYENQVKNEKGAPPNEITEEQARERVDAEFTKKVTLGVFSCTLYKKLKSNKTLDTIYKDLSTVPDTFLAQAYQTLLVCKSILEKTIKEIEDSLSKVKVEGFASPPMCSPEASKQRKDALEKMNPANDPTKCILPEEITPEIKIAAITKKLDAIKTALQAIQGKGQSFSDLYKECLALKGKLDNLKNKAESGTLVS